MRALRSCDFCDAEAVGAFEVVPPELEPTEAEQRRVVLCGDCEAQLETLLEPLLARAGAASTDAGSGADPGSDSDADEGSNSGTVVAAADETTQKRRRTTSPNATVSDSDSSAAADTADEIPSDADAPKSDPESGITFETDAADIADSSADQSEPAAAVEPSDDTDGTDEPEDPDQTAVHPSKSEADSGSVDPSGTDDANDTSSDRPPRAYGKVIRLLRNREFPVDRADAAELAAGAYDLEPAAVDAIIDHAIENDEFVDRDGELHRA